MTQDPIPGIDPGWSDALQPVAGQIAAMGDFLRAEIAAGRQVPPRGRPGPAGLPAAVRRRAGADRRPGPVPDAGAPGGAELLGGTRGPAAAGQPGQHLPRVPRRPRLPGAEQRGPQPVDRARGDAAEPGAHRAAGTARAPTGARAGKRSPSRPSGRWPPARPPLVAILWGRDARSLVPLLGSRSVRRIGSPEPDLGRPRLLRLAAVQPGQPAAGEPGRGDRSTGSCRRHATLRFSGYACITW